MQLNRARVPGLDWIEISARFEAARLLQAGATYTEIIKKTKLSSRTVAHISDWMKNGDGGYAAALAIIASHHGHTPPACAPCQP